jgi:hypothetical protein
MKFLTVVFQLDDVEEFRSAHPELFCLGGDIDGAEITALSVGNQVGRVFALEELLEREGIEIPPLKDDE